MLGQGAEARSLAALGEAGRLRPGTALPPPTGVFPRYVEPKDEVVQKAVPKPKKKASKS
jgi:methionyl-tRNA synthetase